MKRVYTAAEKRAIDCAWDDLECLADYEMGGLRRLKQALKAERHESDGDVTTARANMLRAVVKGAYTQTLSTAQINSLRAGYLFALCLGAQLEDNCSAGEGWRRPTWIRLRDERGPAAFFAREAEQRRRIG